MDKQELVMRLNKSNVVAIMQPTYMPWLGYFSMIKNSHIFIFLDDVQVAKRSWQVRNRIKIKNDFTFLTVPIKKTKSSRETKINEAVMADDLNWRAKHLKTIERSYSKSPYYTEVQNLIREALHFPADNLADFNINFITMICDRLSISTSLKKSSEVPVLGKKDEYLVSLCNHFETTEYLSALGSKQYIEEGENLFEKNNIILSYNTYVHPTYPQINGEFISHLAVVDALFNIGFDTVREII